MTREELTMELQGVTALTGQVMEHPHDSWEFP